MREDVRRSARVCIERDCPDCEGDQLHTLYGEYPAVSTHGAWGKYLNPVYLCHGCQTAHVLLCYETDADAEQPAWGAYPPNTDPQRHLTVKEKLELAQAEKEEA